MSTTKQVAETILAQLGGNRFKAMTGASSFSYGVHNGNHSLSFRVGKNPKKVFGVRISLTPLDVYEMEFLTMKKFEVICQAKCEHVYNDQLQEVFTQHTGLYTSL